MSVLMNREKVSFIPTGTAMSNFKQNMDSFTEWTVLTTASDVADAALEIIILAAHTAIDDHGEFRIVLAGGSTPERVYTLLAKRQENWNKWKFYLGDERCLPIDDPERNSHMIRSTLINNIDVPDENIHFIPSEKGAEAAADLYLKIIEPALPFDLVMLGMGEDGHTASLFPGDEHNQSELVHAVHNAPKPPSERVSLSSTCLSQTRQMLIMITGSGKKIAMKKWRDGDPIPVSQMSSLEKTTILLDIAASPEYFNCKRL